LAREIAKFYLDGNVVPVAGDVSKIDTWHKALKAAFDSFGKLDVVVNNAGVVQKATPSHEADKEEFD
jgi:3-oxoacyl-[acyl-carrier protein] reductase